MKNEDAVVKYKREEDKLIADSDAVEKRKKKKRKTDSSKLDKPSMMDKGGILKMRSGGKMDGLAIRGKTRGRYV
tara:strand:- start:384 stop:605 length:222 start_codon:yes stop_codon:yes gene_type:complete